jgi:hypothetical protein
MKTQLSRLWNWLFQRHKREAEAGPEPVLIAAQMTPIHLSGEDLLAVRDLLARRRLAEDIALLDTMPLPVVAKHDPHKTLKLPVIAAPDDGFPPASHEQFHGSDTELVPAYEPWPHLGDTRFAVPATPIDLPRLRLPARHPPHFRFGESEAATTAMRVILPWRRRDANATREMPVKR